MDPFQNGGFEGLRCGEFGHKLEHCDKAFKVTSENLFVEEEMVQYCDENVNNIVTMFLYLINPQVMRLGMVVRRMKLLLLDP